MDNSPITALSLCSGIGMLDEGLLLGLEHHTGRPGVVVGYCERESYAAAILLARMADAALEPAPVFVGNFEDEDWQLWRGAVDCVAAGFPCQPWSAAGKREGTDDDRWLWPAITRVISEVEPALCWLENVPGLVSGGGLELVLSDLAALGFDAEWAYLSAAAVGASHERERIFILAQHQSRGRGILRQSSGRGGLVGGAVKGWTTPTVAMENQDRRGQASMEKEMQRENGGANLALDVAKWGTPTLPLGGRMNRSGKRSSELLLDGQAVNWASPQAGSGTKGG